MNLYAPLLLKKRKEKGYTQAEFARLIHYSVQTIAKYETGVSEMDVVSLICAARVLGVDCDSFIRGIDAKENNLCDNHDFDPEMFAKNLAIARVGRRVSQKGLASIVNCSTRSIKNYEAGNSVPSLTTFLRICDALKVKAHEFLFEDLSKRPEFRVPAKNKKIWVATGSIIGSAFFIGAILLAGRAVSLNSRTERPLPHAPTIESSVKEESAPQEGENNGVAEENILNAAYLPEIC